MRGLDRQSLDGSAAAISGILFKESLLTALTGDSLYPLSGVSEVNRFSSSKLIEEIQEIGATKGHKVVTITNRTIDKNQFSGDNLGVRWKNFNQLIKK